VEVAMRDISRAVALLLVCHPLLLLAQNPAGQLPTPDQNSILNLYDAFGYQKRGTILDWGFSALVRYNGKAILLILAIAPMASSTMSRRWVWI
jgi:ABC-type ATPase involved in cell division